MQIIRSKNNFQGTTKINPNVGREKQNKIKLTKSKSFSRKFQREFARACQYLLLDLELQVYCVLSKITQLKNKFYYLEKNNVRRTHSKFLEGLRK